jgi:hypothetical protein
MIVRICGFGQVNAILSIHKTNVLLSYLFQKQETRGCFVEFKAGKRLKYLNFCASLLLKFTAHEVLHSVRTRLRKAL